MKNGFDLIKAFYSWVFNNQELPINSRHISLYMFLINQNNRNNWTEWFKCNYDMGMTGSAIKTKRDYYSTLHDLNEWGLIGYIPGKAKHSLPLISMTEINAKKDEKPVPKSKPVRYQNDTRTDTRTDTPYDTRTDTPYDTRTDTPYDTRTDTRTDTHNKTFKPVTYKPVTSNMENSEKFSDSENEDSEEEIFELADTHRTLMAEEKKEEVPARPDKKKNQQLEILDQCQLPFNSERFMKFWLLFLDYKQKQKKPYTSVLGMQAALKKCSEYSEETIIEALTQSMSNNWQGFFPEKINPNKNGKSQTPTYSAAEQFQRLRAKAHSGSN
jgi:hypothetical protein